MSKRRKRSKRRLREAMQSLEQEGQKQQEQEENKPTAEELAKREAYEAFLSKTPVEDRFDLDLMRTICTIGIDDFDTLGERVSTPDGSYIYIDRGASVLGVAHRDSVSRVRHFYYAPQEQVVLTPTLDDRLGCTILLDVLDRILPDNSYDILLTEGEESGRSTAKYFKPPKGKKYNWMFQFDRGGIDAVHYQYTDPDWMDALKDLGVDINSGAFSDICYLEHLAICGVNVGCAYYNYHSERAYCRLRESVTMVERFAMFFMKYADKEFKHDSENYGKSGKKQRAISYPRYNYNDDYYFSGRGNGKETARGYGNMYYLECSRLSGRMVLGVDLDKQQVYKQPVGHTNACECFACRNYWQERLKLKFEMHAKLVAKEKKEKPTHYSDLCICTDCKAHRNQLCKHQIETAWCIVCNPDRDIKKKAGKNGGGGTDQQGQLGFRSKSRSKAAKLSARREGLREQGREDNISRSNSDAGDSLEEALGQSISIVKGDTSGLRCHWCGYLTNKLKSTSGGELVCPECFDAYANKSGWDEYLEGLYYM